MKKSNVYTGTGDAGTTSLVGGSRVAKHSPRLHAYGTIDELNSHIGLLASFDSAIPAEQGRVLTWIQNLLFNIGSCLATEPESSWQPEGVTAENVSILENQIDQLDANLPRHNRFILPGGHPAAAQAHVARTVARRAERLITALTADHGIAVDPHLIKYINRLSDYLFVLARAINISNKKQEIFWDKGCKFQ